MELNYSDPKYQEAMRLYLSGEWSEAQQAFLTLSESYPESPFILLVLGNINYSLGNLERSVELYNEAVRLNPDYGIAYYKLGVCYYRMGKLDDALQAFSTVIELRSQSHAMASYFVGLIHFFMGNDDEAEQGFAAFREVSPESMIANYYLAQIKIKRKKYDEALALLGELAETTPHFAEVYYLLGVAHQGKHNNTEAIKSLRTALEMNPEDERARTKLMLLTDVQWP
ncbi:MAG: tetratricopeptide repeat protein [Spirochaetaceae bacterium]